MRFLRFKFGKQKQPFTVPDGWHDVPFYKFVEYLKAKDDPYEVYRIFTGLSAEYWQKPHHPNLYNSIDGQLAFLSEIPKRNIPKEVYRKIPTGETDEKGEPLTKNVYYKIKKDFLNVPLGKYRDLIEVINSVSNDAALQVELYPKMIGIFACDIYEDEDELNEIAKEIERLPTDLVYSLGVFFCQKLSVLNNGTKNKWKKGIKRQILTIPKLVLTKLLTSTAIFILLILSPKVTLRSMRRYLAYQLDWFINRYNYNLVSLNPKDYTTI